MMVTLAALLNGCAHEPTNRTPVVPYPSPVFPGDGAMESMITNIQNEFDPFWIYFHADMQTKCRQLKALGEPCEFNP